MAYKAYNTGLQYVMSGSVNFTGDTFKMALLSSDYTFDQEHTSVASLTVGRLGTDIPVPATKSVVCDSTNHFSFWKTSGTIIWTGGNQPASGTIIAVCLYKFVTNDAGSIPICYYDPSDLVANNGEITFTPASDANGGLYKIASA
jgi:hypothetical protein